MEFQSLEGFPPSGGGPRDIPIPTTLIPTGVLSPSVATTLYAFIHHSFTGNYAIPLPNPTTRRSLNSALESAIDVLVAASQPGPAENPALADAAMGEVSSLRGRMKQRDVLDVVSSKRGLHSVVDDVLRGIIRDAHGSEGSVEEFQSWVTLANAPAICATMSGEIMELRRTEDLLRGEVSKLLELLGAAERKREDDFDRVRELQDKLFGAEQYIIALDKEREKERELEREKIVEDSGIVLDDGGEETFLEPTEVHEMAADVPKEEEQVEIQIVTGILGDGVVELEPVVVEEFVVEEELVAAEESAVPEEAVVPEESAAPEESTLPEEPVVSEEPVAPEVPNTPQKSTAPESSTVPEDPTTSTPTRPRKPSFLNSFFSTKSKDPEQPSVVLDSIASPPLHHTNPFADPSPQVPDVEEPLVAETHQVETVQVKIHQDDTPEDVVAPPIPPRLRKGLLAESDEHERSLSPAPALEPAATDESDFEGKPGDEEEGSDGIRESIIIESADVPLDDPILENAPPMPPRPTYNAPTHPSLGASTITPTRSTSPTHRKETTHPLLVASQCSTTPPSNPISPLLAREPRPYPPLPTGTAAKAVTTREAAGAVRGESVGRRARKGSRRISDWWAGSANGSSNGNGNGQETDSWGYREEQSIGGEDSVPKGSVPGPGNTHWFA